MMDSLKFVCFLVFVAFSSGLAESLQRRSLDSVRNSTDCSGCEAPVITAALVNQTELVGKKSVLKCFAKGQPTPNITWYKNDIEIDAANKGTIVIKSIDRGSRLKIKPLQKSDSGRYYCKAANKAGVAVSNVAFLIVKDISWNKTIIPITTKRFNDGVFTYPAPTAHPGYCVSYTGQKCSSYINRRKSIYIKAVNQQTSIEKKLQIAFDSISKSKKISDKCKPYVLPLLCHYLFPYCDDMSSDPKARTLCHEECKLLRDDICLEEYIVAKRESLEHVLFPDCGLLPTKDSEAGKNCIHLPLMFTRTVRYREKKGDRCFNGTGQYYRGNVSITEKGFSCQRWNSTEPNYHLMSPAVHHELRGGHNFCRNPGGKKDRPWCFTTDAKKGYDYCAISRCEEEPPTIHVVSILYTVIPCLVIAIIFSSVVIFICWRCHKQIIYQANQSSTPLMPVTVKTDSKIQEMKDSLRILKDVGEGEFGKFYHCEISTRPESGSVIINQVFVSSLRKSHDEVLRQEFLEDKETWAKLTHPNILPIVGICNQGSPAYVLYEYLECGTLHEYLLRHAPIEDSLEESEDDSMTLWVYDLLSIAYQIAAGMNYLSSNDYVHGDIATRNCMIGARFDVKITDFASSRVGYHHDYYRLPNRRPLPVRWMAPESINSYRFTIESDIWSFGVVLWELFSYGAQPYYGLTNEQVIHSFRDYVMLLCPIDCPPSVYVLMTECWDILPPSRPTFSSIYKKLCALRCESSAPLPT